MTRQEYEKLAALGYQARQNGQTTRANPFKESRQMNAWMAGWLKADKARGK